jgi:hypothetical protein
MAGQRPLLTVDFHEMGKLVGVFGVLAICLAILDSQYNGETYRTFILIAEFVSFLGFLCLMEVWAFRIATNKFNTNRWLIATILSVLSCAIGFILFGLAGGVHGGSAITFDSLLLLIVGEFAIPITFIGFVIVAILRKKRGMPILEK